MSQVLTVPTHFNDIGELSDGFLDRVEQDTLILYGPVAYEEGSPIEFAVLLADGTAALEGTGQVRAAVDGGDDRVPETRYDVVVEALSLDARSEVVFERLVMSRQAVSDRPVAEEDDSPITNEMDVAEPEADDGEVEMTLEPADSIGPEMYDDEEVEDVEEDSPTVMAEVDAEAMMAEADASEDEADTERNEDLEETLDGEPVGDWVSEDESMAPESSEWVADSVESIPEDDAIAAELESPSEHENEIATVIANASSTEIAFGAETDEDSEGEGREDADSEPSPRYDSMYAFEHGIAAEPKVGMPVPVPSMAAPPEAPPAPPTLRLAETPDGLMRPSLAAPDDSLFSVDGEVSDVHTTGLFAYEDGLPIPSRPPLPDPNRAKQVPSVEAANDYDVQDSEPPELLAEDYEEVRLSDFAEAVEEG
jgi:hypothetical protein